MAFTSQTMTISAGQAISNSIDCTQGATASSIVALVMPASWVVSGGVTLQMSLDNAVWYDVYNPDGTEVVFAVKPNAAIIIGPQIAKSLQFLRVRSGTSERPTNQNATRNFIAVLYA